MADIGKRNTLRIVRDTPQGLYLDGGAHGEILLPNRYIPRDAAPGQSIDVFIYRDSEDRLTATTETPLAMVGDFAALRVVAVHRSVGAFLDWGLPKDLLLPFAEQDRPLAAGDLVVVAIALDPRSDRIYATTRLSKHVQRTPPNHEPGQPVDAIVARETPLGYVAIVDRSHLGLLYRANLGSPLAIGQQLRAYVDAVRDDGKIDLKADPSGYARVGSLADKILDALATQGGRLNLDDASDPADIRATFGCSKKAFKQALGALLKKRAIEFTAPGIRLAGPGSDKPRG
ncbi:MAG: GntR family transcriptional regulator [Verrucomicrobiae bacterium]|nr:GntR family transcriptional regulator [Verrucomicrobiae bacterium]